MSRGLVNHSLVGIGATHTMSNVQQDALFHLYQPIIGSEAVNLYLLLQSEAPRNWQENPMVHLDLFGLMDVGAKRFTEIRQVLEGIGLLEVWEKEDWRHDGTVYLYLLQTPRTPSEFLQENLFSTLLRQKLGEDRFRRIVERYALPKENRSGFSNTSKTFAEIFGILPENVLSQEEKEQLMEEKPQPLNVEKSAFDMDFFLFLCKQYSLFVREEDAQEILLLHLLYGLNERELRDFAQQSVKLGEDQVNLLALKRILAEKEGNKLIKKQILQTQEEQLIQKERLLRKQTWKSQGFTEEEITGLTWSLQFSPMEMLRKIHERLGTSAKNLEDYVLKKSVQEGKIPLEQLNLLMYYLLVAEKELSLDEKDVYAKKVRELEKEKIVAIEDVFRFFKEKKSSPSPAPKNQNWSKQQRRVEKLPQYMTEPMKPDGTIEEGEKLLQEMKDFFKNN